MVATAKLPKARKQSSRPVKATAKAPAEVKADQTNEELLLKHSLTGLKFKAPPTDEELLVAVTQHWRILAQGKGRWDKYHAKAYDPRYGIAFWLGALPTGEPHWSTQQGTLLAAVRKVLGLGSATTVSKPAKPLPQDPLAGIEVIEEGEFAFSFFKRTPLNPRTSFDQEMIDSMAPNIQSICRLTPILCLADGTIVDGETRHRAGEKAGAKKLFGKKIKCTGEQAAIIRLQTTCKRRDLNPMDRAAGMHELQTVHGLSVDDVAKIVGMKKGDSVRNIVRLLELPKAWQEAVRSEELTAAAARDLVPWKDEPAVLKVVREELNDHPPNERSIALARELQQAIFSCSRPIKDASYWTGSRSIAVDLKPNDEQCQLLRVRSVKRPNGTTHERAFNIAAWDQMVAEAERNRIERESKRAEKSSSSKGSTNVDPAKARENAEAQAKMLAKRLYRFRVSWHQAMIVSRIDKATEGQLLAVLLFISTQHGNPERSTVLREETGITNGKENWYTLETGELLQSLLKKCPDKPDWSIVRTLIKRQVGSKFDGYHVTFSPQEIELLSAALGIEIKRDWSGSFFGPCKELWESFVGLWSKEQMIELLAEWRVKTSGINHNTAKKKDYADLFNVEYACPKAILEAKAVNLC